MSNLLAFLIPTLAHSSLVHIIKSEELRFGVVFTTPITVFFVGKALGAF